MTARTAVKKAAPRKATTRRSTAAEMGYPEPQDHRAVARRGTVAVSTFEPLDLDAEPQTLPDDIVHIFTLDEVDYYVPKYPAASLTLQYLRMARTVGAEAAQGWLMEQLLGEDGYTALMNWPGLTGPILLKVIAILEKIATDASQGASRPLGRG